MIFLFLVGTRGTTFAEICLRLEADCRTSGWTFIITFFIDGDPLQKRTSGAVGRKWNGSPLLVTGSGPSCCCKQSEYRLAKKRDRWLRKNKCTDSVPLPRGLHIQDQFAAVEDLKLFWRHEFSRYSTKYQRRLMKRWRTDRLVLECGDFQTCCSILNW